MTNEKQGARNGCTARWVLSLAAFLAVSAQAGLWEKTREMAGDTLDAAGKVVKETREAIRDEKSPEEIRREIDGRAAATLERLFGRSPQAEAAWKKAAGYAVFDTRKLSFMITTRFGTGVAVDRASGRRTYMKMAGGGLNIGAGAGYYRIVFLFPSRAALEAFVAGRWSMDAGAKASGGRESAGADLHLSDGTLVYVLADGALDLSATLTGTRYYRYDGLDR